MKRFALYLGIVAGLVASCSTKEIDFQTAVQDDVVFYASFEQPADIDTRVYANEDLLLRWTADDRVSIFNKVTYNQEYIFTGETGDNGGTFSKVGDEFATGNAISHIVSLYPYQKSTKISENESLTIELPAEQLYAYNTFGLGANTMVSVTSDNLLQYKNVGGYLVLKLYGEGVSVSSIALKGNNGEKLAGKANVTMPLKGVPTTTMTNDATSEITLTCATPVQLGATAEESTQFWFVVPPVVFSKGFTITVSGNGGVFEKTTEKTITIERNSLSKMAQIEIEKMYPSGNILFADEHVKLKLISAFDANNDGELSYKEAADVVSGDYMKEAFGTDRNYRSFDEFQFFTGITSIPDALFKDWTLMTSIILPNSLTSIGADAFRNCAQLASIHVPDDVVNIGPYAFGECNKLESINIPEYVSTISDGLFLHCGSLSTITLPQGVTSIGALAFCGCINLKEIFIPDDVTIIDHMAFEDCEGLASVNIPGSVKLINNSAFFSCEGLTSVIINEGVTTIGSGAFNYCTKLASISIPKSISNCTGSIFTACTSISHLNVNSVDDWLAFLDKCGLYAYTSPLEATSQLVHFYVAGTEITRLDFSSDLVKIPNYAFMNCAYLSTVTIPETVSSIGAYAFYRCAGLTSVQVLAEAAPRGGTGMFASTGNCPIYVPAKSVNEYKSAPYWSDYADRIQSIPTPVPEAVDLGLSVKWASFNLGASKPEEYGDYYAWGETETKEVYSWETYKWCEGTSNSITKYNSNESKGIVDNKTVLDPEDDAATVKLGGEWRIPTSEDIDEIINSKNCKWEWTYLNGVSGYKVTSKIDGFSENWIFLPASGLRSGNRQYQSIPGAYWSSTFRSTPHSLHFYDLGSVSNSKASNLRYEGCSIRPVTE